MQLNIFKLIILVSKRAFTQIELIVINIMNYCYIHKALSDDNF